jgi:hypothetical protein
MGVTKGRSMAGMAGGGVSSVVASVQCPHLRSAAASQKEWSCRPGTNSSIAPDRRGQGGVSYAPARQTSLEWARGQCVPSR